MIKSMTNEDKLLLLQAIVKCPDEEKKIIIKRMIGEDLPIYRYRHLGDQEDQRKRERNSLKMMLPWASRYDMLDDQNEGITTSTSSGDYLEAFGELRRERNTLHQLQTKLKNAKDTKQRSEIFRTFNTSRNPLGNQQFSKVNNKSITTGLRDFRKRYSMVCFTENSPYESNNLWDIYAKGSGFAIEYSLFDILEAGYIIAPIFYTDDRSIADIDRMFQDESYLFLTKTKCGIDHGTKEERNWESQNEWRIIKTNNRNKTGHLLEKPIQPIRVYTKDTLYGNEIEDVINEMNQQVSKRIEFVPL